VSQAFDVPAASAPETDDLAELLRDPEIRASLAMLLANAPTLAALTAMGGALMRRGPEITDNINSLVTQARGGLDAESGGKRMTAAVGSLADLAPLAPALAARSEVITGFLDSPILQPEIVDIVGRLGEAAMQADQATRGRKAEVGGVFALLRELKDPQVQETLAFLIAFAKTFGDSQSSHTPAKTVARPAT
jgi:uncharacterized protein YjgD (DUF1641 family)